MPGAGDNQMVVDLNAQRPGGIGDGAGQLDIVPAGGGVARGVVVDHPYGPHNVLIYMIYFA